MWAPRGALVYCAAATPGGFTKAMAIELAPAQYPRQQHRAHLPGDADDAALFREQDVSRRSARKIKLGRLGPARGIDRAIVFLASDASSLIDRLGARHRRRAGPRK